MEKTKAIISTNLESFKDFEYYFLHLEKINKNFETNPDIAIETCKSLIEGVSKSILNRLDNTFDEKTATSGRNAKSVQQLFKWALEKISEQNDDFEIGYVHSSGQIINITSEIRTERGDISHGKSVPKTNASTIEFAKLVMDMTDLTMSYVLKSFFEIDLDYKEKLNYVSEELQAYNNWLDENTDFPIKKAKYSQLLYENDYDEYESRYSDEFLKTDDEKTEKEEAIEDKPEIKKEPKQEEVKAEKPVKEIEKLVGTFDEESFWDDATNEQTEEFAESEKLKIDGLKNLITDFLFSEKKPLRDDVSNTMNEKPSLKERAKTIDALTERIIAFANDLKKQKGEE
ncbi:MAG: hypothetical protein WCT23_07260 [Candidatus Neomarinimicrobiota bacterium]|jgi:hypothetical protein